MARDGIEREFWQSTRGGDVSIMMPAFRAGFLACRRLAVEKCKARAEKHSRSFDGAKAREASDIAAALSHLGESPSTETGEGG